MNEKEFEKLFKDLFFSKTENDLDITLKKYPQLDNPRNWKPLGNVEHNIGLIENQQSSPIAALIEKITNSIDAILMKKCYESKIDPKSTHAPKNMEEAISKFFNDFKNWDLSSFRKQQAEEIQIIADGPRMETSLIVYDNGEGQHPEKFEETFLSLLAGNKSEIHFVQGKYNMGGTGAIAFCGRKRYQLIGSKKYDNSGKFGFTLIRKHKRNEVEQKTRKDTWYEYLLIDGNIPAFTIAALDLGLHNRSFKTGTVLKLYSYDLPEGSRSVISRDLNQSINEFLFEPALPILTIDKPERYPKDINLQRDLYGLKRRLESEESKYIEDYFSIDDSFGEMGRVKITCYVFMTKIDQKSVKESKETIQREFFKNNMSVMFSLNGQTHGHYGSEFITRSLKMPLLKDYLLIHIDCTNMNPDYRNELFMASRDRLKGGLESRDLRNHLATILKKSKLEEIDKRRRASISIESSDTNETLKALSRNLPLKSELYKLLNQTFKLNQKKDTHDTKKKEKKPQKDSKDSFQPKRYPSYFKLSKKNDGNTEVAKIPIGGERIIAFSTDVENSYFDRIDDPGDLKIALLNLKPNDVRGGLKPGLPKEISEVLNIRKASPDDGTIKISMNPTENVSVGDAIQVKVEFGDKAQSFEEIFWVKICAPEEPKEKAPIKDDNELEDLGLPEVISVYKEKKENHPGWENCEEAGISMDEYTVVYPLVEGEQLVKIYINMDSHVLMTYKSNKKALSQDQIMLADNKYLSAVYFHVLFLYTISKQRKYAIQHLEGEETPKDVDLADYLSDLFKSYYSEFLLNFGMDDLLQTLGD
ncbi:MAG: hypothetical protein PHV30_04405 [Candidatus Margulisbacteria bacterium]|nr:hypothetical protein [Candidatus Margulisiibacteriota bacterium]